MQGQKKADYYQKSDKFYKVPEGQEERNFNNPKLLQVLE